MTELLKQIPGSPILLCKSAEERDAARDAMGFGLIPVTFENLEFREIQRTGETMHVYALPALTGEAYLWAAGALQLFSHCKVCAAPRTWKAGDSLLTKPMMGQELWDYMDDAPALRWEQIIKMGQEYERREEKQRREALAM